jgi:hypothetical protein
MSQQNARLNARRRISMLLPAMFLFLAVAPAAQGQPTTPPTPTPSAPTDKAVAANPAQMLKDLQEKNQRIRARIQEIENILFPIEEEIAKRNFFFTTGEYAFLRIQSETSRTSSRFFEAQSRVDRDSWDAAAAYFDLAYDALKDGYLWVGREQSLVGEDTKLFNDLQTKVREEMEKRPDAEKLLQLITERDQLRQALQTSGPLLKYLTERRLWWRSYPDYVDTVKKDSVELDDGTR